MDEMNWATDESQFERQLDREADRERDAHYDEVYEVLAARGFDLLERAMAPGGRD